jgi:hypothetical protein
MRPERLFVKEVGIVMSQVLSLGTDWSLADVRRLSRIHIRGRIEKVREDGLGVTCDEDGLALAVADAVFVMMPYADRFTMALK